MRWIFAWFLCTVFLYPLYTAATVALDTLIGQQLFLTHILFESRRVLMMATLHDSLAALPWSATLSLVIQSLLIIFDKARDTARTLLISTGVALATAAVTLVLLKQLGAATLLAVLAMVLTFVSSWLGGRL